MALNDTTILICGQRFTSRTETVEKYIIKVAKKVGIIAIAGVRQKERSNCKLYDNGKIVKDLDLGGLNIKNESFLFTILLSFYFLIFAKNFFSAYRKLGTDFQLFIGIQTWGTILGILLKKMGRVDKVIYYCIDYYKPTARIGSRLESFVFRHLDRYCCRNADFIWYLGAILRDYRKEYFPNDDYSTKELVVPLTYSESLLRNRQLDEIEKHSIAFVGTLEGEQGWELFIKSIPIVKQELPDLKVHIFGEGSYRSKIEHLIDEVGVRDSITMHGFIKDETELLDRLSRCAIGIAPYLPRKAEYSGLDAGKPKLYTVAGLPIIMTHTEYIESQFQRFKIGKTFRYDPESLANAVLELMRDDEKLREYKNNANAFARQFTSEVVFPKALAKTLEVIMTHK